MTPFHQLMSTNPARLVVLHRKSGEGIDQFQWGLVGGIPVLALIGAIARVQSDMISQLAEAVNECPEQAFVIAFKPDGETEWFLNRSIPVDPLVGMLETVKAAIIGGAHAQHAAAQRVQLLGPDGSPIRRSIQ